MDADLKNWLADRLSKLDEGIHSLSSHIVAIEEQMKHVHRNQDRATDKLDAHDRLISELRLEVSDLRACSTRMSILEEGQRQLQDWRVSKNSEWNGPQKATAMIIAVGATVAAIGMIMKVFAV